MNARLTRRGSRPAPAMVAVAVVVVALGATACDSGGESPTTTTTTAGGAATPGGAAPPGAPGGLPEPRTEVAGTALGEEIVVVGGLLPGGGVSARADAWSPRRNDWEPLPDLPIPLHHTAVVTLADRVWAVGGYTAGLDGGWIASERVFSIGRGGEGWDDAWRDEPSLSTPRGALAAAATPASIVAGGGVDPGGTVLATVETLESGGEQWSPGPELAQPREHFAMTAAGAGGDVYAVGGRVGGLDRNLASVERLAPGADAWVPAGTLERSRGGIGAAAVDGRPCVAGGEEPAGTIAEVECQAPDGAWRVVARLDTPRHGLAVVSLGGSLHVVGGGPEPGLTVSGAHEVVEVPGSPAGTAPGS